MNNNKPLHNSALLRVESQRKSLRQLRKDMVNRSDIDLDGDFIIDNNHHSFTTHVNGKDEKAFYEGHWYPFGDDGPVLTATYGIKNETKYEYSETV
jgi:hypothetical protein